MTDLPFGLSAWHLFNLAVLIGGFVMSTKRTTSSNEQAIKQLATKLDEMAATLKEVNSKTEQHEVRLARLEEWRKYQDRDQR